MFRQKGGRVEIEKFDLTLIVDHDVTWSDISVNNAM
jgi:hypothetical protein